MAKFLILMSCLVALASAGVLDTIWRRGGGRNNVQINTGFDDVDIDSRVMNKISRMTGTDLMRQKLLLKLLDHVHETLNDETIGMGIEMGIGNNRDEFVTNDGNYRNGIDEDMIYVIELQRSGGLLGKRQIYTIADQSHKRQMVGLKRLLARAVDFDTFLQNAITARNCVNGVLFVNAILLAVRERDDTRDLIVPAIYDILPALYIDRDTLSTLRNLDINLLTTNTGYDTMRPNLLQLIGLNGRIGDNRWGNLGNLVSLNRNSFNVDEKIVIDEVNKNSKDMSMKLLTSDVGFKAFLHNLINELCLKENELEKVGSSWMGGQRNVGLDYGIIGNRGYNRLMRDQDNYGVGEKWRMYGRNQINNNLYGDLPTTTIDDERLLHVNSKKMLNLNDVNRWNYNYNNERNMNQRGRYYDVMNTNNRGWMGNNLDSNLLNQLNVECIKCIERKNTQDCKQCLMTTDNYVIDRLGYECKRCIRDVSYSDCEKCKNKIENNVGLNDNVFGDAWGNSNQRLLRKSIYDGRRTVYSNTNDIDRLSTNCIKCIERQNVDDCNKCQRITDDDVINQLDQDCKQCIRNVDIYECDKCKRKLNLDNIQNVNQFNDWTDDDRYINQMNSNLNTRDRFMDVMYRRKIDDGRRTKYSSDLMDNRRGGGMMLNDVSGIENLNTDCIRCIERTNESDCKMCQRTTDDYVLERLGKNCKKCIKKVNDYECDKCKAQIGLNGNRWGEGDVNMLNWNRLNSYGGRLNENYVSGGDTLGVVVGGSTKSEILLHNLKQILSRINLERLSLGLDSIDDVICDDDDERDSTFLNTKQYLGLDNLRQYNNLRNMRTNVADADVDVQQLTEIIKTKIERKLKNLNLSGRVNEIDVDRVIAKALIQRDGGNVNILDVLTDVLTMNVGGLRGVVGVGGSQLEDNMQIARDIDLALNDRKVLKVLRRIVKTIDNVRTEILGTYKRDDLEFDDVKINDIQVDQLITYTRDKDIDVSNILNQDKNKVVVVRQKQLTHKDFNIKIDVDSKLRQRVVVRTLLGPKRIDDMGRQLSLNERRAGFMLLDTNVVDLNVGRNIIQRQSRNLRWTKRDITTLSEIYKRIMLTERVGGGSGVGGIADIIGEDCRLPRRLILPRGRVDGLELELLVIITPFEGGVNQLDVDDITKYTNKCGIGMSMMQGVDGKSLGFPLDRQIGQIGDMRDLRNLNNVEGIEIKIYHNDDRRGNLNSNWW